MVERVNHHLEKTKDDRDALKSKTKKAQDEELKR